MKKLFLASAAACLIGISSAQAAQNFNFTDYVAASVVGVEVKRASHKQVWQLGQEKGWRLDQKRGLVYWVFDDGLLARAPVQIVGTYNKSDNTFLWAWDHKTVLEPLREHASKAKAFGTKYGIEDLTKRKVQVSEDEAFALAAVTNRIAGGNGIYKAKTDGPTVFMTFGEVELNRAVPES